MREDGRPLELRCPRCHHPIVAPTPAVPVTCGECGVTYECVNEVPVLLPETVDEEWRAAFEHMYRTAVSAPAQVCYRFDRHHDIMRNAYERLLGDVAPASLFLDVGCGHGKLSESFTAKHAVVGVDIMPHGLPVARTRGLTVFQGDASALPFADDQFDVVLCAEVLQNLPDVTGVLRELARVCRPGGRILVSTLNRASLLRRAAAVYRRLHRGTGRIERLVQRAHQRTAAEVMEAAACAPVVLRSVTWAHFPSFRLWTTRATRYAGQALASNFLLSFEKQREP